MAGQTEKDMAETVNTYETPAPKPLLWIIVPCYNEQEVLPVTAPLFREELEKMISAGKVSRKSRILFVNDGSADSTWGIIQELARKDETFLGISQSRNRGHQNAVLAGLMESREHCDITISIDCDGQDDVSAMERMVDAYLSGAEVVYGVRSSRKSDSFFKRITARSFYRLMNVLGAEVVYDHADYRLVSSRVLQEFADFHEVNLFLRGMIPLVGFPSASVSYEGQERMAGSSHYPLRKMLQLAFDGITSLSVKPINMIAGLGGIISLIGFLGVLWAIIQAVRGATVAGWASIICIVCFLGGIQLLSIGVIGEYIGKIYLETKDRPRFNIEKTLLK